MRPHLKIALVTGALALSAAPAIALGDQPSNVPPSNSNHGAAHTTAGNGPNYNPSRTPGPKSGLPAQAKAYGRYCQGESKQHVAGQPGTPFSQCVLAMSKLATGTTTNPAKACKSESKQHVKGEKGTPYSRCVSAAAKLKHAQ